MPKASAFGGRGHIPLPHPPPMASQAGHAWLHRGLLLLFSPTEHPLDENPGYATASPQPSAGIGHGGWGTRLGHMLRVKMQDPHSSTIGH